MGDDKTFLEHPEDDHDEEEGSTPSGQSRMDRLMGAKDRAEKEEDRWSEIEQLGTPLPSSDQQDPGMTMPLREPPRKKGDTPVGKDTPPEELPAVKPSEPAKSESIVLEEPKSPSKPKPSFPHPTDPPTYQPPAQQEPDQTFLETPQPSQTPAVPRDDQSTPRERPDVRVDADGMPLPRRVPREDLDATLVGDSALRQDIPSDDMDMTVPHQRPDFDGDATQPSRPDSYQQDPYRRAPVQPIQPIEPIAPQPIQPEPYQPYQEPYYQEPARPQRRPAPQRKPQRGRGLFNIGRPRFSWGCIWRFAVLGMVFAMVAVMLSGAGWAVYYNQVTAPTFSGIQTTDDLRARALQFETTRIRDREGNILYQINDPQGGLRDYVPIEEISPWVVFATIATEERSYFTNPGFSLYDIGRAVYQNYREGAVVSGASTITQQITRALLLPEEERTERTYSRKIKEIFLAAELGRRFSKADILELYLNQVYYGNLAYGIEAAAQTYFNKSARDLTLAEASFLVGIPQAPAVWDPVTNKEAALQRQQQVLSLALEARCLDTGETGIQLPCVTETEIAAAQPDIQAITATEFQFPDIQAKYPHWVVYVQQQLEADPAIGNSIYTSGYDVYTTLDPRLQDLAQQQATERVALLADRNVHNASVVVLDVDTGAILAMVGSVDFDNEEIDGQVNVAQTLQQPGSSIKPFTYLATFREGWTPATVIWDVPIEYEIPGFGIYEPVNYDGRYRGPVTVREAIANSLNIPAVLALDHVGVPALLQVVNDVGVESLGDPSNPLQFGLSLTLGAGEVTPLEWTNAYATIARDGVYLPTYAIERIEINGQVIEGYPYEVPEGVQAIDPAQAYLLQNILSDQNARVPAFGPNTPLNPDGYVAGAKTGTTNDARDTWTMGFSTELALGIWVGNTDNSPMVNMSGASGAAFIWRGILDGSREWYPPQAFDQPPNIVFPQTVCRDDGAVPSEYCLQHSTTYQDVFAIAFPPPEPNEGLYQQLTIDTFSGLIANEFCQDYTETDFFLVPPNPSQLIDIRPAIRDWLVNTQAGQDWAAQRGLSGDQIQHIAPTDMCGPDTPRPTLIFSDPVEGSEQEGNLIIRGTVDVPNFAYYTIDYGLGPDPQGWSEVQGQTGTPIVDGVMGQLNLEDIDNGLITLRLTVVDQSDHRAEGRVTFIVNNPDPTPTEIPSATPTNNPTATPSATPTETPTATATP